MWWLLIGWLLLNKQPTKVSGTPSQDAWLRNQMARNASKRGGGVTDHRGGGSTRLPSSAAASWTATSAETRMPGGLPGRSVQSTLTQNLNPNQDPYGQQYPQAQSPYGASSAYGMPQTMPQTWQDQGYDDAYAGFDEGEGEGDDMVATPGHWRRAKAGEEPDTPDGMVWEDD